MYLETAAPVSIRVEGGPHEVRWISARDAADRRDGGITQDRNRLKPPGNKGDWLVGLRK